MQELHCNSIELHRLIPVNCYGCLATMSEFFGQSRTPLNNRKGWRFIKWERQMHLWLEHVQQLKTTIRQIEHILFPWKSLGVRSLTSQQLNVLPINRICVFSSLGHFWHRNGNLHLCYWELQDFVISEVFFFISMAFLKFLSKHQGFLSSVYLVMCYKEKKKKKEKGRWQQAG